MGCLSSALVTELYVHTALFWFALVVAMSAEGWFRASTGQGSARLLVGSALVLYVMTITAGLRANLADMRASGERSRLWRTRIQAALATVPRGSVVVLRGLFLVKAPGDYGLYRVSAPGYLLAGKTGLLWDAPPHGTVCLSGEACERGADFIADIAEESGRVGMRRPAGR